MKRTVLGVYHHEKGELEGVKMILKDFEHGLPSFRKVFGSLKVGLGIPEVSCVGNSKFAYFEELADYAHENGWKVCPLENREHWNNFDVADVAKRAVDGRISPDSLSNSMKQIAKILVRGSCDPYMDPKQLKPYETDLLNLAHAEELVRSYSPDEISELWQRANCNRENYVLNMVSKVKPDVSVIGRAQAQTLDLALAQRGYRVVLF